MELQDTFVDSLNTADYNAPGDIPDHTTPEERAAFIDGLNHSSNSGQQKLFAFLNRFGTVTREEFNQITGIYPDAQEWSEAAGADGVMDKGAAGAFFGRGNLRMTGGKDERTGGLIDLKYDRTMLLFDKFSVFLDEHGYLTREELIYLSDQDIDPDEWKKYAGEDGRLDTAEFETLAKDIFGFRSTSEVGFGGTPEDEGRTGETPSEPPGLTEDKDRALYLQNLIEDNTILTTDKVPEFIEKYGQVTREEFNYLSGENVTPEEWKKYAGADGKIDAGEYQKFSKAFFNIPEELNYQEKYERLQKVRNIKHQFNAGMFGTHGKRENAFKAALKELGFLTREEVEILNGPRSYQTVGDGEWEAMAGKDGQLMADEYDAWVERDQKVRNIKLDFNRGKYDKREGAFKAAFKELGFLTRSEVEILNGPNEGINNSEWKEMAGEDGVLSKEDYDAYGPDKAPLA